MLWFRALPNPEPAVLGVQRLRSIDAQIACRRSPYETNEEQLEHANGIIELARGKGSEQLSLVRCLSASASLAHDQRTQARADPPRYVSTQERRELVGYPGKFPPTTPNPKQIQGSPSDRLGGSWLPSVPARRQGKDGTMAIPSPASTIAICSSLVRADESFGYSAPCMYPRREPPFPEEVQAAAGTRDSTVERGGHSSHARPERLASRIVPCRSVLPAKPFVDLATTS
jgi:hypothetical protein